ncbi:MAG: hypothetical protein WCV85_01700 [Patescibacteria group bacterium]
MKWHTSILLVCAGGFISYRCPWQWEVHTAGEAALFLACTAMAADILHGKKELFLRASIPVIFGYTAGTLIQWA